MRRRAQAGDGGIDFAVIRFKIPGFDDLTLLPRILAAAALVVLAVNRFVLPGPVGVDTRLPTEILGIVLAGLCWVIPWAGARLDAAQRRQVRARPETRPADCMLTLALPPLSMPALQDLAWATGAVMRFTNADGLAVWKDGEVMATRGLLRQLPGFRGGPSNVLSTLGENWRPTGEVDGFCVTQAGISGFPAGALPSGVLPGDTEAVLAKPLPCGGQLVLWSSQSNAFDRAADRRWVASVAAKIDAALGGSQAEEPASRPGERCFEQGGLAGLSAAGAPDEAESVDPFLTFSEQIRTSPGVVGFLSFVLLIWYRVELLGTPAVQVRGVETAQSRVDLVAAVLATCLLNQALIWLSEVPEKPFIEDTSSWVGVEKKLEISRSIGAAVTAELEWAWQSLEKCTRICSAVIFWRGECVMQGGYFRSRDHVGTPPKTGAPYPAWSTPKMSALCEEVVQKRKGRYLAQLRNYPAKEQFQPYLPELTQGLVLSPLQPVKDGPVAGVLVLGVDSIRGVGKVDQAWVGALAEKLAVSLGSEELKEEE